MKTTIPNKMKKIITISLLFIAGIAGAQNLFFADPALRSYLLTSNATNNIAVNSAFQSIKIDADSNGEIDVTEAAAVTKIWIESAPITSLNGIEGFTNMSDLGVKLTSLSSVTLPTMPNVVNLTFLQNASLTSLNVSGAANVTQVSATDNPALSSLVTLGCNAMTALIAYNNALFSIDVSGITTLQNIYLQNNVLLAINVSGCTNLNGMNLSSNNLSAINVDGLTNLVAMLVADNPNLGTIHAAGCTSLEGNTQTWFNGDDNISYADFSGCTSLTNVLFSNDALATLKITGCSSLISVDVSNNFLTSLDLTGCNVLQSLNIAQNSFTLLDLTGHNSLLQVTANDNQLTSVNVSGIINLTSLSLTGNPLANFNASGCSALSFLNYDISDNDIVTFDISNCPQLTNIGLFSDFLQSVNVQGCTGLITLAIQAPNVIAPLTALDVSGLSNLQNFTCSRTHINTLNVTGCSGLTQVMVNYGDLAAVDFSGSPNIVQLNVSGLPITELDVSNMHALINLLAVSCPELTTIFAKNGANESFALNAEDASLVFICQDENAIADTLQELIDDGLSVNCNSYCSFTPGGNYNTITGIIHFDADNNGCDASDPVQPNVRINIDDSSNTGATFTENAGNYVFYTGAGNFNLTPSIENPTIFNISPSAATIPFADANSNTATQDFCVSANGIHNDVEIAIAPIIPARPGFFAYYAIVIKNKGNQTLSGNYNLTFDGNALHFSVAAVAPTSQSTGLLNWNYSNLLPFESRVNYVLFNVNGSTQSPPVNIGDILNFTATVNPIAADFTPGDNQIDYNETVTGSYDPNDITCLEGNVVSPAQIGNYLHYIVNFENTGTAPAENIVVRIDVDPAEYDINSLQLMNTSHPAYTRITGDRVEFIFENIQLPSSGNPPVGGHGDVLFKIKSNNGLVSGDHVDKKANIYFDYNAPVETLPADTVFQLLANPEFPTDDSISIYPNPVKNILTIHSENPIRKIEIFDIQGRLLQISGQNENAVQLDLSDKSKGVYFIRISSDKGIKVEKIIKE